MERFCPRQFESRTEAANRGRSSRLKSLVSGDPDIIPISSHPLPPRILALFSLSHLWRQVLTRLNTNLTLRLCPAACKACVEGGLYITTDSGERAMLRLNRADVEGQQAAGGGQGALQKMAVCCHSIRRRRSHACLASTYELVHNS